MDVGVIKSISVTNDKGTDRYLESISIEFYPLGTPKTEISELSKDFIRSVIHVLESAISD